MRGDRGGGAMEEISHFESSERMWEKTMKWDLGNSERERQ